MFIDRRYFRYFDWLSFLLTLILLSLGLLFVFSATYTLERPYSIFFKKQLFGALFGLIIYLFFCIKDLRNLTRIGYLTYFGILLLLLYTLSSGWIGMGGQRWISLYFFKFQPSEIAKLFLPSFIAFQCFGNQIHPMNKIKKIPFNQFITPLVILFISFFLILKQPDLGTALIILFSGIILLWFVGLPKKFFLIAGLIGTICTPVIWKTLRPYQQQRVLVLLGHGDVKKERYQIEQSKIAIGSGGLFGKGLLKGTQNKLAFLPADHTDFIFSVICEEWGLVGAIIILLLFALLFSRILLVTMQIPDILSQIISVGLVIHILLSVTINIGMVVGLLPIVGIPLPLFSYGLCNLWITLATLGWLNNIAIRRFYY